jgi:hypothetical protein
MILTFFEFFALLDCAAARFEELRYQGNSSPDLGHLRIWARHQAVQALRYLWRTADASRRAMLAERVYQWAHDCEPPPHWRERILKRERVRQAKVRRAVRRENRRSTERSLTT